VTRVLLTGAGGFVGSHALRHIMTNTDWEVICPVTFAHRGSSDRIRLALEDRPEWKSRIRVHIHDLSTPISVVTTAAWHGVTHVLNFASESHVDRSITHPVPFILNNCALVTHLLEWARYSDITTFVQFSTDEVYGPADPGVAHRPWLDDHRPSNPYSASKAAQEDIAFAYWRTYDVPLILTNTMNIVGETQDAEKFIPKTLRALLRGEQVTLHGDPVSGNTGSRFYLHARNAADGVLWAVEQGVVGYGTAHVPRRWHIVGEREISNFEMARLLADVLVDTGHDIPTPRYHLVDYHSTRPGHDLRYALDDAATAAAGWKPPVPLEESLARTVCWSMEHPEWLGLGL
jgi:dTDP-glucose 4,6-dehydratase